MGDRQLPIHRVQLSLVIIPLWLGAIMSTTKKQLSKQAAIRDALAP